MDKRDRSLVVAALVGTFTLLATTSSCGDDPKSTSDVKDAGSEHLSLMVTRDDGSRVRLTDYQVSCEPQFYDGASPSGAIIEVATPLDAIDRKRPEYFFVQAVVADVEGGASYDFGLDFGFVYDDPSGADVVVRVGQGEPFTGAEGLSDGTLTIHSATCSPRPAIDLELSGTLANEYETEGSVQIDGQIDVGN